MDNGAGIIGVLLFFVILGSVAFWVWICHLIAKAAKAKGRSYAGFFCLSFFFSPLLGWIIVLAMANAPAAASTFNPRTAGISGPFARHDGVELFKCPKCAEWVKSEAIVCRFCGSDISQALIDARAAQRESLARENAAKAAARHVALKEQELAQLAVERARANKRAKMAASRERLMRVFRSKKVRKISVVAAAAVVVISIGSTLVSSEMYKQGMKDALVNTDPPMVVGLTSLGYDPNAGGEDVFDWQRGWDIYLIEFEHPLFRYLATESDIQGVIDPYFDFELIVENKSLQRDRINPNSGGKGEVELNRDASKRISGINNQVQGEILITRSDGLKKTRTRYAIAISGEPHQIEVLAVTPITE